VSVIRDLLYFDFDKAASLQSQVEGGLPQTTEVAEDNGKNREAGVTLNVPAIGGARLGVDYIEKRSVYQTRVLHHDLLTHLEETLRSGNLVRDLVADPIQAPVSAEAVQGEVARFPYVHASGSAVIEDYERMRSINDNFKSLVSFIVKCAEASVRNSQPYQELLTTVEDLESGAKGESNRVEKARLKSLAAQMKKQLDELAKPSVGAPDQWMVDGLHLWINTFMPRRIRLLVRPYAECPFELQCNLKRSCFVDDDLEHLLYGYGTRPTVPLVVLGLVTSVPPKVPEVEEPQVAHAEGRAAMEQAFRRMFRALDGLESYSRFDRYPNVVVHPIAVYRDFGTILGN
jgi:hypothetical protein